MRMGHQLVRWSGNGTPAGEVWGVGHQLVRWSGNGTPAGQEVWEWDTSWRGVWLTLAIIQVHKKIARPSCGRGPAWSNSHDTSIRFFSAMLI